MANVPGVLAVVFDFDDTLVPDSTTKLLNSYGINTDKFWNTDVRALVTAGYDPALAYLTLIIDMVGKGKPLGDLSDAKLREFGSGLDPDFYRGLPRLFADLRTVVGKFQDMSIEFYIVSGGLEPVILGSRIVQNNFTAVYGCRLADDPRTGLLRHIRRCVTFTEKTRYLFEINKGIDPLDSATNPYLVNADVPSAKRRIPFENMIYVGDGLTDVPCFSLVNKEGGFSIGVFQPAQASSAKRAFLEFLLPNRVLSAHAPRYRPADELGSVLRTAVTLRCGQILLQRQR